MTLRTPAEPRAAGLLPLWLTPQLDLVSGAYVPGVVGEVPYFFRGIGCAVHLPAGAVDWDFGHEGRSDGFDAWRLARFAENRSTEYAEITDWRTLQALLVQAESRGFVERFPDREYDRLFYLKPSASPAAEPGWAGHLSRTRFASPNADD